MNGLAAYHAHRSRLAYDLLYGQAPRVAANGGRDQLLSSLYRNIERITNQS